ncbi:MAG: thiamine phosphate synthase [Verrucomicrobiia bacterium]
MPDPPIASARLYGFIDTAYLGDRDPGDVTRAMMEGGVDMIQVRAKEMTPAQRIKLGMTVLGIASRFNVPVIINDDVAAAAEINADGVHLGQEDWSRLGGSEQRVHSLANMRIVGLSTHSLEQALAAERDGADYIGVGPIFPTATKPGAKSVGLDLIRQIVERVATPFFAIGGITLDNLDQLLDAGTKRVAVVSAILNAPDVRKAAAAFKRRLT